MWECCQTPNWDANDFGCIGQRWLRSGFRQFCAHLVDVLFEGIAVSEQVDELRSPANIADELRICRKRITLMLRHDITKLVPFGAHGRCIGGAL
jgi:hypothetical protein